MDEIQISSSLTDKERMERRRNQLIKGAVTIFKEKGFHRTSIGEIAEASNVSIGTLYEYIQTKEEVLFLVCDSIYERVQEQMGQVLKSEIPGMAGLEAVIRVYFQLMDEMQDEVVVMYQDLKSLTKDARGYVLEKEKKIIETLETVVFEKVDSNLPEEEIMLIVNNILIQGQMWAFRRWILQKDFSIQTYTDAQIKYLMNGLKTINKSHTESGSTAE